MYAVQLKGQCKIRYVELAGNSLVLRPHNQSYAVEVASIGDGESVADYVVGRICYVGMEI
jgi:hypothetical protein